MSSKTTVANWDNMAGIRWENCPIVLPYADVVPWKVIIGRADVVIVAY